MAESNKLNDFEECPLCGCSEHTKKFARLYGYNVCKKCRSSFSNRRYIAYAIDELVVMVFIFALFLMTVIVVRKFGVNENIVILPIVLWPLISLTKDGYGGYSLGKALFGLRVINENDGKPIGFWCSIKRNYRTLNALMPIRIIFELRSGHRTGDERGQSKVIWEKYSSHLIFLPRCLGGYDWLKEKRDEKNGEKLLSKAIKTEIKGNWDDAIILYEKIMSDYPSTEASHNAKVAMKALKERINEMTPV